MKKLFCTCTAAKYQINADCSVFTGHSQVGGKSTPANNGQDLHESAGNHL